MAFGVTDAGESRRRRPLRRVAAFDVNETLLDLSGLDGPFARHFGDVGAKKEWFARLLHTSVVISLVGRYVDFATLGEAALRQTAESRDVDLAPEAWDDVARAMCTLRAYPDVVPGLARLREAGWTLASLTNSPRQLAEAQLANAGIAEYFSHMLSVDQVRAFKPAARPYELAATILGVELHELWMVACHDWDLAGAAAAGCKTAFVRRPGLPYSTAYAPPSLSAPDVEGVAALLAAEG